MITISKDALNITWGYFGALTLHLVGAYRGWWSWL